MQGRLVSLYRPPIPLLCQKGQDLPCHPFGRLRAGSESFDKLRDKLREGSGAVGLF